MAHPRQRHRVQSRTIREGELREVLQFQSVDRRTAADGGHRRSRREGDAQHLRVVPRRARRRSDAARRERQAAARVSCRMPKRRAGESQRGDVQAHLAVFEVGTFEFSTRAGYTGPDQEAALKAMNQMVLCTYPVIPSQRHSPEDDCRRDAIDSEWQGTAADLIKQAYGGNGLPNPVFVDTLLPDDWKANGQHRFIRMSWRLRVAAATSFAAPTRKPISISRPSTDSRAMRCSRKRLSEAPGFDDRIKAHVIDRGNMPLAKIVYDTFWSSSNPPILAAFLEQRGFTVRNGGTVLQPGRPVADPGPDRVIGISDGSDAAFRREQRADGFVQLVDRFRARRRDAADRRNARRPESVKPTLTVTKAGAYVLQLVASQGFDQERAGHASEYSFRTRCLFARRIFDSRTSRRCCRNPGSCLTCHTSNAQGIQRPPVFFGLAGANPDIDRNGDGIVNAADDALFYAEVRGRINFTDVGASALLRKPAGHHHNGGRRPRLRRHRYSRETRSCWTTTSSRTGY